MKSKSRSAALTAAAVGCLLIALCQCAHDTPPRVEEGRLTVGSADLFYRCLGRGPLTIVLHGGPGDSFDTMLPLAGLADEYRLVFYDQRASARSTGDADTTSHTIEQFVEDLEQLRRRFGDTQVNLIGGSWGTMVALQYAARHPEHVRAMVLLSCMGVRSAYMDDYRGNIAERRTPDDTAELRRIMGTEAFAARERGAMERFWRTYFRAYCCDPAYADSLPMWIRDGAADEVPGRFGGLVRFLHDYDLNDILPKIACPTLILHGDCDPTPLRWVEPVAAGIDGARLVSIPDAGHWLWVEGRDRVLTEIRAFLAASR